MASSFIPPMDTGPNSPSSRQRRRNAALSCAECRRLKLRCSRVFPCASCVKKGCAAICPKGSLTTGKGNRFILANTEVLHDKIGTLSNRVRQLEDALSESHRFHSSDRHPLLSDELLQIKRPLERESRNEVPSPPEAETSEVIDDGGSLSLTGTGRASFYGPFANSYYLLKNENDSEEDDDALSPVSADLAMTNTLAWRSHAFPFASNIAGSAEEVRALLMSSLPDLNTVQRQIDIYWRHASWMYTPIDQKDFYSSIYGRVFGPSDASADHDRIQSHRIAVVYMMLAIGALLDLDAPSHSDDATHYFQLGRAALSVDSIFEEQSIPAIQALLLMSHYMFLADIDGPRWALMGLVVKLAHSCGLHRDSGRWGLGPEETFRRRSLFWEIYVYDSWQSLTYGRPPSFSVLHIDTQLPQDPTRDEDGEMSFQLWKYRFSSQCLSVVHDQVFGARTPNYKVLQQLDRKVREFYTPPSLQVPGFGGPMTETEVAPVELTLQRYIGYAIREITLFYMHRGFFARAIEDSPEDPLGSKYAPSVLAVYNSACSFVGLIKSLFSQQPALTERMWFLFTHVFSCAIVLGSIPIKCPSMALARSALSHLDSALRLFEEVSQNAGAIKVLPVLRKQRERAINSMTEHQTSKASQSPRMTPEYEGDVKKEDEELATLGGKTRLVPRKASSSSASSPTTTSASPRSSPIISNVRPGPTYASHLSTPPLSQALPAATIPVQAASQQQVAWQSYEYQPQPIQTVTQPHHAHSHSQPQAATAHNQMHVDHQYQSTPQKGYDYTAYWQHQQAAQYAYNNGTQAGSSTGYAPMSPGSMGFDYAASLRAESYLAGPVQPLSIPTQQPGAGPMQVQDYSPGSDPDMAWNELVAQFNHV
ncbi:fungal-specific transcription factor domain-containing protein [Gloeopeniophorella convolvens]|nr:fungal-specific transcription factor domain-containing protein [Gloeopeniophorella convolvens]